MKQQSDHEPDNYLGFPTKVFAIAGMNVFPAWCTIARDQHILHLTKTEMLVLETLLDANGNIVLHEELLPDEPASAVHETIDNILFKTNQLSDRACLEAVSSIGYRAAEKISHGPLEQQKAAYHPMTIIGIILGLILAGVLYLIITIHLGLFATGERLSPAAKTLERITIERMISEELARPKPDTDILERLNQRLTALNNETSNTDEIDVNQDP